MNEVKIEPIRRLLIANRGEIARRVIRTAHEMGIATVAVHADGDVGAPFVVEADSAIALDGKASRETYLDIAKVLSACRRSGADAVHPGYGFLSENAAFAKAVLDAGLRWVGPSPDVASHRTHRRRRSRGGGRKDRLPGPCQGLGGRRGSWHARGGES